MYYVQITHNETGNTNLYTMRFTPNCDALLCSLVGSDMEYEWFDLGAKTRSHLEFKVIVPNSEEHFLLML